MAKAVILLVAFTVALNTSLALGTVSRDPSWAILLAGAAYALLSMVFAREVSLWASLLVLLAVLAALTHSLRSTSDEAVVAVTLSLLAIGVVGVALGTPLTPWILLSPFIEQLLSQPPTPRGGWGSLGWPGLFPLYAIGLYLLSLQIPLVLAPYPLGLALARPKLMLLAEPEKGVIDSAARLALVVVLKPWIHVL